MDELLKGKLVRIKLFATDFDGVHTDGTVLVNQDGIESVRVSRKDGLGLEMLRQAGIEVCIISKETNPVVAARARKLGIPVCQSVETGDGKREILERLAAERGITLEQVLYMGDDVNDIPALKIASVAAAPADCHELVRPICHLVSKRRGGHHAIREIIDLLLAARGLDGCI